MKKTDFEVVIIGGSYAGLSAAMTLGRALRNVLIIDSGKPCNEQTPHSHNFLTQDGISPADITAKAKKQVLAYPTVRFEEDIVVQVNGSDNNFNVSTASHRNFTAKKILFATGIKDTMPEIPGFSESWGISVIHCPYCHGYEYKGQHTGILANGDTAFEFFKLVDNWTPKITLLTNGPATFDKERLREIANQDFTIVEKEIQALLHDKGNLKEVVFRDGSSLGLHVMYARIPFVQHTDLPEKLGCELDQAGYLQVDGFKKTTVAGIYAAGDNTSAARAVSMAASGGTMAGAAMNKELIEERFA